MKKIVLPKIITINREAFDLTLWRSKLLGGYKTELRRGVTLGQVGHETPTGLYFVESKTRTPDWKAPDSDWVPEDIRGHIFDFEDPRNPFAGGFISISGGEGIGIHGTKFDPLIGTMASHGCIRMRVTDFESLYLKVSIGTPVFLY